MFIVFSSYKYIVEETVYHNIVIHSYNTVEYGNPLLKIKKTYTYIYGYKNNTNNISIILN